MVIQHLTFIINGAPEIELLAADFQKHLVDVPGRTRFRSTSPQSFGVHPAKLRRPSADGFVRHVNSTLGEKVFDIIEAEPDRLREVTGIGAVRAKRITDAWAEQKIVREIMVFLHSNGVGTARAVRIYKTYGADAVQVMTENPYRLARDIRGIGFKTADAIAMKLGVEKTAMIRVRAGISYALTEAMDGGHCGLPTEELVPSAVRCSSAAELAPQDLAAL